MKTVTAQYKDQPALVVESELLRATFLPTLGAKLASLIFKPAELELLLQRPNPEYRVQPFDGDYVAGECSGMDDMFPTIDLCYYTRHPWQGVKLADHGEVWSLPWDAEVRAAGVRYSVNGVRLPYRLEKTVTFPTPQTLRMEYTLANLSNFEMDFVWVAHMMLNAEEGATLTLPEGVKRGLCVFSYRGDIGKYGDSFPWPLLPLPGGGERDLRRMRPKAVADTAKYYIEGRLPAGWCRLDYPSGVSLQLSFPVETVPYLAILPNEGGWQGLYNIFLEPSTATFDRPDIARNRDEISTVAAKSQYHWFLEITLDHARQARAD